jgi:hypothetical protein
MHSVDTLVSQALSVKDTSINSVPTIDFFPDNQRWIEGLAAHLKSPNPAIGVMRPMAGAAFLVPSSSTEPKSQVGAAVPSFAVLVRMAIYTSKIVDDTSIVSRLPTDVLVEVLHSLVLTVELVSDQIDLLPESTTLEGIAEPEAIHDLVGKYLFPGIIEAHKWQRDGTTKLADLAGVVHLLIGKLLQTARSTSPSAYYAAKAVNHLLTRVLDAHGCSIADCDKFLTETGAVQLAPKDALANIGILSGFGTNLSKSKAANTLCNRLVSAIADARPQAERTLGTLALLNAALAVYDEEEDELPVSTNRLVFAVKQILSWTDDLPSTDPKLSSEACHALQRLLPAIKEVYGTYWESALEFCEAVWESNKDDELSDEIIPMVGMSLKLYSVLRKVEDPNDDLQEALASHSQKISEGLVHVLKLQRPVNHKPLDFVDTLLLREVREISPDHLEDQSDFYLVLSSDNRKLQSAAFHVLHTSIPSAQQQISVDVLLEKKGKY